MLAMAAMISVQAGAAVSTTLFARVGPVGAAWLRLCWAAVFLLAWARPKLRGRSSRDWMVGMLGIVDAGMTICYFEAIARIPLGMASALEFLGPLAVAVAGLRNWVDVVWPLAAASGVIILTTPRFAPANPVGIGFALAAAVGWASYILLTQRVGDRYAGVDGLAVAMTVAAIVATIPGAPQAADGLSLQVIGVSAAAALLLPVLPYAFEMWALRRINTAAFGTLMSLEPAIAACIGFALLGQALHPTELAGLALVVIAGAGAARRGHRSSPRLGDAQESAAEESTLS